MAFEPSRRGIGTRVAPPDRTKEKELFRASMRRLRSGIPAADRPALAARAEARLLSLAEVRDARAVLLFYSFGSEIPTAVLLRRLLERRVRVLLPYLDPDAREMEAAEVRPGDPLHPTEYGPREPARRVPVDPSSLDVVVTPGLAFDRRGHRLGYGGGFYDRYLERLHPHALRVGIGFAVQVVDEVPVEERDQRVDLIVTDAGIVRCDEGP
jgi:5-formyltetrahydrofolate cyclo-ligase